MPHEETRPPPRGVAIGDLLSARFQLLRLIAEGRLSNVYEARDLRTGSLVAAKVPTSGGPAEHEEMLRREAFILERLHHPNIVRGRGHFCDEMRCCIVLDLARDGSLQDRLDAQGPLSRRKALFIALALIDALEICQAEGVVHRDIKPDNVLFNNQRTMLADFSVAAHPALPEAPTLRSGAFLAPELLQRDARCGTQTDIYGLCATLYHAMTGWNPYRLFDAPADSPRWASLDEPTRELLYRGTRANPQARIPGLPTFKAEVLHMLAKGPAEPTPIPRHSTWHESTDQA